MEAPGRRWRAELKFRFLFRPFFGRPTFERRGAGGEPTAAGGGGGGGGVATAPLLFPSASAPRRQLSPLSPTLIRIRFTAPTKQRFYFDPLKIQVFK